MASARDEGNVGMIPGESGEVKEKGTRKKSASRKSPAIFVSYLSGRIKGNNDFFSCCNATKFRAENSKLLFGNSL